MVFLINVCATRSNFTMFSSFWSDGYANLIGIIGLVQKKAVPRETLFYHKLHQNKQEMIQVTDLGFEAHISDKCSYFDRANLSDTVSNGELFCRTFTKSESFNMENVRK